ncbi:GAP family protein [Mycobacterium ulcerans]|uniref:GAP family protein n=1 Tax=Mycobacterium ulcerans TaxID=1809 RepID=A0ABY3VAZ4_MYCUL|nr:GAP family protein [Mycobacterium ulcerans]UDM33536.1 GAP family protein [Mycobacterium ulcerans]ULP50871.1 GAP family protein [Mycobacterium ulcerans]
MWTTVLILAVMTATEPVRLGVAIFLVSKPRPMVNLLAFWFGGMATGIGVALAVLLLLGDLANAIVDNVSSLAATSVVGHLQVGLGVVALLVAALVATGFSVRSPALVASGAGDSSTLMVAETPTRFSRLMASAQGALEGGFPWAAFVVGLSSAGPPPVEYLVALTAIGASGAAMGTQLSATFVYLLVMLAIIEIPLIGYLVHPGRTEATMLWLRNWLRAHRRQIIAVAVGLAGIALVTNGMGTI